MACHGGLKSSCDAKPAAAPEPDFGPPLAFFSGGASAAGAAADGNSGDGAVDGAGVAVGDGGASTMQQSSERVLRLVGAGGARPRFNDRLAPGLGASVAVSAVADGNATCCEATFASRPCVASLGPAALLEAVLASGPGGASELSREPVLLRPRSL